MRNKLHYVVKVPYNGGKSEAVYFQNVSHQCSEKSIRFFETILIEFAHYRTQMKS